MTIKFIFDRVQDLSRKDKAGYMSSEEFNRDFSQAQDILYEYYYERFEQTQEIVDSINPFHKEVNLPISGGYCQLPQDYRHRTEVAYLLVENSDSCTPGEPTTTPYPMSYLNANEEQETLASAIRRPSLEKRIFRHSFINNKLRVYPKNLTGYIAMKYLAKPPAAVYGVTLDVANDQENYDPATSIDPIWNDQDGHHLIDIMLLFKGIETRETALIEWIGAKRNITTSNT